MQMVRIKKFEALLNDFVFLEYILKGLWPFGTQFWEITFLLISDLIFSITQKLLIKYAHKTQILWQ